MDVSKNAEKLAELVCELTRNCTIKEEFFASSFNLSPTEVKFLKKFAFTPSLSIKELCGSLRLSPGRITHIATSLEKKNLVKRCADESDKRNIIISLTPKASPFISNLNNNYIELHKRMLEKVNPEDQGKIFFALNTLVEIFRNWVNEK